MLDLHLIMNRKIDISSKISNLNGIGPKYLKIFEKIGINSILDLLLYFPRSYNDYRKIKNIIDLKPDEEVTIKGEVILSGLIKSRRKIYEVQMSDGTSNFKIIWFNPIYGYLKDNFKIGSHIILSGKVLKSKNSKIYQMINPSPDKYLIFDSEENIENFANISPTYPLTKGLSQNKIKNLIQDLLRNFSFSSLDILSEDILTEQNILQLSEAIKEIHIPDKNSNLVDMESSFSIYKSKAHKSIIFFEFLILCLGLKIINSNNPKSNKKHKSKLVNSMVDQIKEKIPFSLTKSQNDVIKEIYHDMESDNQMNRLLQGDVGSGKTIIGLMAMAYSYDNNYQSCMIAPTEILADQHYYYLKKYIPHEELALLKSSLSLKDKEIIINNIKSGKVKFIVGTHSLFQPKIIYKNLGLIVIDEQHRFGVEQRKLMIDKGFDPHILTMTATPIPRTLSSIFFSNFDISILKNINCKKQKIVTEVVDKKNYKDLIDSVYNEISAGRQVFFLCPLINKSENDEFLDLVDVNTLYNYFKTTKLSEFNFEIVHGELSSEKKEKIMDEFRKGNIDFLISTTVIEVGVDIPNASIMIIHNPERFGLSQLHQLRGRVGRGNYKSHCYLVVDNKKLNKKSLERIDIFSETNDGFELSEVDLSIRGPGAFYGAGSQQSGNYLSLNMADIKRDLEILKDAKNCCDKIEKYDFFKKNYDQILENINILWGKSINLKKIL